MSGPILVNNAFLRLTNGRISTANHIELPNVCQPLFKPGFWSLLTINENKNTSLKNESYNRERECDEQSVRKQKFWFKL